MRQSLPYFPDISSRLRRLSSPGYRAAWLRLSRPGTELFAAFPERAITLSNQSLTDHSESYIEEASDWREFWTKLKQITAGPPFFPEEEAPPFLPGTIGFMGYEGFPGAKNQRFPTAFMGLYPRFIYIDHHNKAADFISPDGLDAAPENWRVLLDGLTKPAASGQGFRLTHPFTPLTPPEVYRSHFERIQAYLKQGDCYQVNYAQCFTAGCQGSSAAAMDQLLAVADPAYAAWLSLPEGDVLSLSPELFLKVDGEMVLSKPIKGTAPRSADPGEDMRLREELRTSPKNRAENLMIVDLLRHDIGQHAKTGSVKAESLFEVESLPQVHHLVSTVTGKLKPDSHVIDLIRDCFPGGSITGAPKKRAMEIIRELEPARRSVYCGSIGYISANGNAQMNIAIRTLLRVGNELYAWAGGGIVADSECEAEYQECFHKIGALMRALEGM